MIRYGAVEAGGTKWVCALADTDGKIVATEVVPTTTPDETIPAAVDFFRRHPAPVAVGVATFGPVDLATGHIMATPKPGWSGTDVVTPFREGLGVPVGLDTDVNGAAIGELRYGAGRGLHTLAYMTVGTGIGVGVIVDGRPLHGRTHPEAGHMLVPHDTERDPFAGMCPFHGDCLEGLASGSSMRQRWGRPAQDLEDGEPWELEADYLAKAVHNLASTLSPQAVIIGGGVGGRPGLLDLVRARAAGLAGGYALDTLIFAPGLGNLSGVTGAAELARMALDAT
ncbi:ROK family protein [Herbidospora mongoliensis]|uniref:ROK family protein n=1 Tax=Herbidospora mongoliensis TaxID=688067 RepID=UPI000A8E1F88|nr:ROK family protein [Herbidospora mongoliensis]